MSTATLRIDVLNPAGVVIGQPIMTAFGWKYPDRLDRAGQFSFQVPASETRVSYLADKNLVRASAMLNGQWTAIGQGIIEDVQTVAGTSPTILTISGPNMLGELIDRSVGNIQLAKATSPTVVNLGISSLAPTDIHMLKIDVAGGGGPFGTFPYSYETKTTYYDSNTGTHQVTRIGSWHFWYICYDDPYTAVNFFLWTPQTLALSWRVQFFNGNGWFDLPGVTDTTVVAGKSLSQNGTVSWPFRVDMMPLEQSICPGALDPNVAANYVTRTGFWTRWIPVGPIADGDGGGLNDVDIREITISGVVPTDQAVANILGVANGLKGATANASGVLSGSALPNNPPSLGWSLDVTAGLSGTLKTNVFGVIQDDSVLTALTKLSEQTNEHFRMGSGRQLVWLGTNTPNSGVRAIRPFPAITTESNTAICAIIDLQRKKNTAGLCTRVIPYGAGQQNSRVTLALSNRPASFSWVDANGTTHNGQMDKVNNVLFDTTAQTTYGWIESVQTFSYITPVVSLAPPSQILAANALYDAALVYLIQHSVPVITYQAVLGGLAKMLAPGQTMRLIWKELTDTTSILDIDQTLIILEATSEVLTQGYMTTSVLLSQYAHWPLTDAEVLARLEASLRHLTRYGQPLGIGQLTTPGASAIDSGMTLFTTGQGAVVPRISKTI